MKRIAENYQRIEIMSHKSIRERLLAFFYSLEKKPSSNKISIPYSFTDLADYLVLDRSAMMRELTKMQNEHLIIKNGKEITLIKND